MGGTIDEDTYIAKLIEQVEQLRNIASAARYRAGVLSMQVEALDEMNQELSNILIQNNMFTEQELDDIYEEIWKELSEGSE